MHLPHVFARTLVASALAASIGCSSSGVQVPVQPLAEAQSMRLSSGMTIHQRLVIRDASTWSMVWLQIVGSHRPIPPVPAVDFTTSTVLVAAMGVRPTGGYAIAIDEVELHADAAAIAVDEQSPGPGCVVTASETTPVAVVVVPSFRGEATFLEHMSQLTCR
ncbi:MAG: protease complex subunit PrcB family protein [Deltaproteobacteria bacterium]|nr:MAG: protease complex subunit PrcB family protein [Deltaproteobacteria bacterium]TMQ24757.1 MAG: protease complex subunit PrcB family protein [Deltaproteobacteria bacterium]